MLKVTMFLGLIFSFYLTVQAFALPEEIQLTANPEEGNRSFNVSPEVRGISRIALKKFSLHVVFELKNGDGDILAYSKHPLGKKKIQFKLFSGAQAVRARLEISEKSLSILDSQNRPVSVLKKAKKPLSFEFWSLDGKLLTRLVRMTGDQPNWKIEVHEDDELSPEMALALAAYESRFEMRDFDRILGFPIPSKRP